MNGFYILAHDANRLEKTLDRVNNAIKDLQRNHLGELVVVFLFSRSNEILCSLQMINSMPIVMVPVYYFAAYSTGF